MVCFLMLAGLIIGKAMCSAAGVHFPVSRHPLGIRVGRTARELDLSTGKAPESGTGHRPASEDNVDKGGNRHEEAHRRGDRVVGAAPLWGSRSMSATTRRSVFSDKYYSS